MGKPILLQIDTSGPLAKGMNCLALGSGSQRSHSQDAKVRFGGRHHSTPSVK